MPLQRGEIDPSLTWMREHHELCIERHDRGRTGKHEAEQKQLRCSSSPGRRPLETHASFRYFSAEFRKCRVKIGSQNAKRFPPMRTRPRIEAVAPHLLVIQYSSTS